VIAVNDAYRLAPWADVLYACDLKWWKHHHAKLVGFAGLRFSVDPSARGCGAQILRNTGPMGLERDPTGLRTGKNSGYQAINLAVHLGAKRILLLGYDCQRTHGQDHFFGPHPKPLHVNSPSRFLEFRGLFASLVQPLAALQIEILNLTRETALTCFPRQTLESLLVPVERAS